MAWRISWHLSCDHCRKTASFSGQPSTAVERKEIRYGWAFTRDDVGLIRHLCKACAGVPETKAVYEGKVRT